MIILIILKKEKLKNESFISFSASSMLRTVGTYDPERASSLVSLSTRPSRPGSRQAGSPDSNRHQRHSQKARSQVGRHIPVCEDTSQTPVPYYRYIRYTEGEQRERSALRGGWFLSGRTGQTVVLVVGSPEAQRWYYM